MPIFIAQSLFAKLLLLLAFYTVQVDSSGDPYHHHLGGSSHYEIDISITGNDYEMIKRNEGLSLHMENKDEKLRALNQLARKEYEKSRTHPMTIKYKKGKTKAQPNHTYKLIDNNETYTWIAKKRRKRATDMTVDDYNYDDLVNEYFFKSYKDEKPVKSIVKKDTSGHHTNTVKNINIEKGTNSTKKGLIGYNVLNFLMKKHEDNAKSVPLNWVQVWKIMRIWFYVYLAIAVPLWCIKGWCCWCLCCDFFNPRRTIERAKKYVIQNPPGVLKGQNGDTLYQPTDREREVYEEFEHLLRHI